MSSIRAEIWCAAFVRRHNNLGNICVISKKGDPVAGQVWIEIDHLDNTLSLFTPAPSLLKNQNEDEWAFVCRFERAPAQEVKKRIALETGYDPDFWLITLESRSGEHGLNIVKN